MAKSKLPKGKSEKDCCDAKWCHQIVKNVQKYAVGDKKKLKCGKE